MYKSYLNVKKISIIVVNLSQLEVHIIPF